MPAHHGEQSAQEVASLKQPCVLQGIIGDTYERFTVGQEAFNPNSTYFLPEDVRLHFPSCYLKIATTICLACPWHSHLAEEDRGMCAIYDCKL